MRTVEERFQQLGRSLQQVGLVRPRWQGPHMDMAPDRKVLIVDPHGTAPKQPWVPEPLTQLRHSGKTPIEPAQQHGGVERPRCLLETSPVKDRDSSDVHGYIGP